MVQRSDESWQYKMPAQGTPSSNPRNYFFESNCYAKVLDSLSRNDLRSAIITGFGLSSHDDYVYHAIASVSLSQVQGAVEAGTENGLCDWYPAADGSTVCLINGRLIGGAENSS